MKREREEGVMIDRSARLVACIIYNSPVVKIDPFFERDQYANVHPDR